MEVMVKSGLETIEMIGEEYEYSVTLVYGTREMMQLKEGAGTEKTHWRSRIVTENRVQQEEEKDVLKK